MLKGEIEEKVEDMAIKIMTDDTWIVSKFIEGQSDITSDFAGWECQYYSNLTSEARKGTQKVTAHGMQVLLLKLLPASFLQAVLLL